MADYDSVTKKITNVREYTYQGTGAVSHFDGITATATGYNLTGEFLDSDGGGIGAFFASITREAGGSFSAADWTTIAFPGASVASGNTVISGQSEGAGKGSGCR